MKNIVELRKKLCEVVTDLGNESTNVDAAREQVNAAGKILGTVKMQLAYSLMRNETPKIDFMAGSSSPKTLNAPKVEA